MRISFRTIVAAGLAAALVACNPDAAPPAAEAPPTDSTVETVAPEAAQNVLTLSASGLMFEGAGEIASGWTTVRFDNASGMVHFAVLERLPEGITIDDQLRDLVPAFQGGFDQMMAGDEAGAAAAFAQIPDWFGDVVYIGGPGLVGGGNSGEATLYLEPGRYSVECYVKSGGVFHTATRDGARGMLHELIVTETDGGAREPEANVTLALSNDGMRIAEGAFVAGANMVRVNYIEQQVHGTFSGHDVHVARLDETTDMDALEHWMDWRNPEGLQTPAPVAFLGGINEMPAGSHGYFPLHLTPGRYGLISEIDDPGDKGFVITFDIE